MNENNFLVEARDLSKVYESGNVQALKGVSFGVRAGEFVSVIGPSGSGKSTLLNLLGALDRPTSGEVLFGGELLSHIRDLDRFRAQTVGFIFQLHNLLPSLTALENVEVFMQGGRLRGSARRVRAMELLTAVGLAARMKFLPTKLSGGERQRVAIARALANEPMVVLADEPTGNLDTQATGEVMALLKNLNRERGTTFVVVTHNPAVARMGERTIAILDGRIVRDEPVAEAWREDLPEF
jgi:ABC-type lipoprotein export system ATPase subunit